MFSNKFKNKAVRAHQKSLDATFNNLGNKIKELGLDLTDEKTIVDILDKAYTDKHLDLQAKASRGEIVAIVKPEKVTPAPVQDDLAAALGSGPGPAPLASSGAHKDAHESPVSPAGGRKKNK